MPRERLIPLTIRLDRKTYDQIKERTKNTGESFADEARNLVKKGLRQNWSEENINEIALMIREQLEVVLKPHVERLAALNSKSGHMSATATFLTIQALQDLVPDKNRKDVIDQYNSARKMAVNYFKGDKKEIIDIMDEQGD